MGRMKKILRKHYDNVIFVARNATLKSWTLEIHKHSFNKIQRENAEKKGHNKKKGKKEILAEVWENMSEIPDRLHIRWVYNSIYIITFSICNTLTGSYTKKNSNIVWIIRHLDVESIKIITKDAPCCELDKKKTNYDKFLLISSNLNVWSIILIS